MSRLTVFQLVLGAMLTLDLLWWFEADRRLRPLSRAWRWRVALAIVMFPLVASLLAWVAVPALFGIGTRVSLVLPKPLLASVFVWHLVLLPGACLLLGVERAALLVASAIEQIRSKFTSHESPAPSHEVAPLVVAPAPSINTASNLSSLSRRQLLAAAMVVAPPVILGGCTIGGLLQQGRFRIRRMTLPVANLPPQLEGLTIAHVSDIHLGRFTNDQMLHDIVNRVNALAPDLVLIPGDVIDISINDLDPAIRELRRLTPRHGLALSLGNHDLIDAPDEFIKRVRAAGLPLLVDDDSIIHIRGAAVQLLGAPWRRHDNQIDESIARLAPRVRADALPILLAHHPHSFDAAACAGIPLTLAGHTHGGQLMLTDRLGPGPMMYRYWSGLYRRGDSSLVVSNGVGNWFPLRINAPAEVVHLTLTAAQPT